MHSRRRTEVALVDRARKAHLVWMLLDTALMHVEYSDDLNLRDSAAQKGLGNSFKHLEVTDSTGNCSNARSPTRAPQVSPSKIPS